jgi:hypothetical protein
VKAVAFLVKDLSQGGGKKMCCTTPSAVIGAIEAGLPVLKLKDRLPQGKLPIANVCSTAQN